MELEDEISMRFRKIRHYAVTEVGGELLGRELGGQFYLQNRFFLFLLYIFLFYFYYLII